MPLEGLPLDRPGLDRDHESRRDPQLVERLRVRSDTRVLVLRSSRIPVSPNGGLVLVSGADAPSVEGLWLYLGRTSVPSAHGPTGTPILALVETADGLGRDEPNEDLDPAAESDPAAPAELRDASWASLRETATALVDPEVAIATTALALAEWHASYGHSPRTGEPTRPEQAGWVRRPEGGRELFPRTDAAVIVCVLDGDDRLLLGHNAMWDDDRYSLLAGFVEPGESLEQAVIREVQEESGVMVDDVRYVGSQPWPFPASLMVGFTARLAAGQSPDQAKGDGEEILSVRWFTRDEVASGAVRLPGGASIARAMIDAWVADRL